MDGSRFFIFLYEMASKTPSETLLGSFWPPFWAHLGSQSRHYTNLREFACELTSSWPLARVEGRSEPQSLTPDPLDPVDPVDPLVNSKSRVLGIKKNNENESSL